MNEIQEFQELTENIKSLSDRKIRAEERFKTEKDHLEKIINEITSKGYDPKKISEIKKEKEAELKKLLQEIRLKIDETNQKLKLIEA